VIPPIEQSDKESTAERTAARVVHARNAVAVVFALNGLAVASWFARIPAARDALDLPVGKLGLVLIAMSAGAVLAMVTAGAISSRLGTGRVVAGSTALLAAGLVIAGVGAGLLGSIPVVVIGLAAIGYGSGTCDVAMNVEAALVERRLGRTVMPRFHAAWSIGTVTGAMIGAGTSRTGLPIEVHLTLVAAVVLTGTLIAVRSFLPASMLVGTADPDPAQTPSTLTGRSAVLTAWTEPRTLLIGLLVLVMAFTEGTANDWIAVAFVDGYRLSEAGGAVILGVFVTAMTIGRTVGTVALDRWGRVRVLLATMLLGAAGATVAVLAGSLPFAVAGVAIWGLGASLGFPVGMSAAADDESRAAARVGVVALIGYTAFLAGPPVVGLLGDRVGILRALLIVPILIIPALALVPVSRPLNPTVNPSAPTPTPPPK
jgi:MFS family permease